MTLFNKRVSASNDDAIENRSNGSVSRAGNIEISSTYNPAGVRFTNVTIPKNATIDSATLNVYVSSSSVDEPNLYIYGQAVDNAGEFLNATNDISSRTKTTAKTTWYVASPGTGTGSKTSPDITAVIQEIVNRAGWASGNALVLIFVDISGSNFRFRSWDTDTATAAELTVNYTVSGGGGDPPPDPVPDSGDYSGGVMITGDGDLSGGGPYIDVFTVERVNDANGWTDPPSVTPRVRLGRLDGVLGGARGDWGIAGGVDLSNADSTTAQYFVASDTGLWLQNLSLRMYKDAKQTVNISPDGSVRFGTDVTTNLGTGFRYTPSNGNVIMGAYSPGKVSAQWRAGAEEFGLWRNISSGVDDPILVFDKNGNNTIDGWLKLGTSGGIYQGTGTPDSPTSGLKMWNSGGKGRISFYDSSNLNIEINEASGIALYARDVGSFGNAITFRRSGSGTIFGGLDVKSNTSLGAQDYTGRLWVESTEGLASLEVRVDPTKSNNAFVRVNAGDIELIVGTQYSTYMQLNGGSLFAPDGGVAAGYSDIPGMGKGVFASDLNGNDFPAHVWQDTADVAHGMTSIASASTYGNVRKHVDDKGGIKLSGFTKDKVAISLEPYVTNVDSVSGGMTTGKHGALRISAHKKSGTSAGAFADGDLLFTVEDDGASRFGVTRQGNFYYDGAGTAFDAEDDMGLISAIAHTWEGTVTQEWEQFIDDHAVRLREIGVLSGNFINGAALNRLVVGALRQMMTRINQLEELIA